MKFPNTTRMYCYCLRVLALVSIVFVQVAVENSQALKTQGPSVVVVLPPGLDVNKANSLSVAVNGRAEIQVKVYDAAVLLQHVTVPATPGRPSTLTVGPFPLVNPSSFIVRVEVRSLQGVLFYSNVFHLQKIAVAGETYLETDKSIYRPMETVRFRVLPLTPSYRVNTAPLIALIKNPDGLVVRKEILSAFEHNPFVKSAFALPQHLSDGRWAIVVKDQSTDTQLAEKRFDVFHYDLPKFELLATSNTSFYNSGYEDINVVVVARLITGRPVSGTLTLTCSSDHQHQVLIRTSKLEGVENLNVNLRGCWSTSSTPVSIQIRAELRDYSSGDKQMATIKLLQKSNPYSVKLLPLRPGLIVGGNGGNYSAPCLITVTQPNGRPAGMIPIQATVDCIQQRNRVERLLDSNTIGRTDEMGQLLAPFYFNRSECSVMMIKVSTNDAKLPTDQQSSTTLLLPSFISDSTSALGLDAYEVKVGDTMDIKINSASSPATGSTRRLLAFSEFGVLEHLSITNDNRSVRLPVRSEMSPEFVLLLYHVTSSSAAEAIIVQDIMRVFATFPCPKNDISLKIVGDAGSSIYQPGSNVTLSLSGAPGGFVATKAVDRKLNQLFQRVLQLEQTYFKDFKRRDALRRLFENRTFDGFDFENRRNLTVNTCCSAGRIWWQFYSDCTGFPPTRFPYLEDCRLSFVSCCSGIEFPRADPACQRGLSDCSLALGTAGGPFMPRLKQVPIISSFAFPSGLTGESDESMSSSEATENDLARRLFPEVWLFDEYEFGNQSRLEKSIALPHSITNWTITGQFWLGPSAAICPTESEISIDLSLYLEIDLPLTVFVGDQMLAKVVVYNFQNYPKEVRLNVTKPSGLCTANTAEDWNLNLNVNSSGVVTVPLEFLRVGSYEIEFTLYELAGHNRRKQLDRVIRVIEAMERENIDSSLDYNFSWDLSSGDSVEKWINDSILVYKFVRVRDRNSSSSSRIGASVFLTPEATGSLKINKLIARFTPLPAAKRARWSKLRLPKESLRNLIGASNLNELLIRAPSILQIVEDSREADPMVPNPTLVEANQILQLCLMETLSFRRHDGAYSPYRVKEPYLERRTSSISLWLTAMATVLHCRTGSDISVVCPSLVWLTGQQNPDGSFESPDSPEFTHLKDANENKLILTSFILLTLRACSDYGMKCSVGDGNKRQYTVFTKSLAYLTKADAKKADPLVLGSVTLAFAAWKHPFARPVNDALLKLLEEGSDYPYWTYKPHLGGWLERVKHGTKGWFSAEYRRQMLSSQISLNAMALLAQVTLGNPAGLNLQQIGQWLIEHRKRDGLFVRTLDTILASRALIELHRSLVDSETDIVTRISVQCENRNGCPSIVITPQNAEITQTLNLNVDSAGGLTFLVTGRGAVYVKLQLIGKTQLRDAHHYYPVHLLANTSAEGENNFWHDLCFRIPDDSLASLTIEHTFSSGLVYSEGSFSQTQGDGKVALVEPTSHSVNILYSEIPKNEDQCYVFSTKSHFKRNVVFSLRRPIVARHASLGVVGITVPAGQNQGAQVPLLEKYCPPNSTECFCAEALCPPPDGECSGMICRNDHMTNLLKALCDTNNTGCLVKVIGIEEENVTQNAHKRIRTSRHLTLNTHATEDDCKNLDILIRKSCKCPIISKNDIYVLVARKDALLETTIRNFRPTLLLGEHGFFEPYFACAATRHSDIHKLVQENQRREICASLP